MTPDARNKERFVIVDAVGVTETELSDSYSLERQPTVPFDKLLDLMSMGSRDPDVLSSLARRLTRLDRQLTPQDRQLTPQDRQLTPQDRQAIEATAKGASLQTLVFGLANAADPDAALDAARQTTGLDDPPKEAVPRPDSNCWRKRPSPSPAIPSFVSFWWTSGAPTSRPSTPSAPTS